MNKENRKILIKESLKLLGEIIRLIVVIVGLTYMLTR